MKGVKIIKLTEFQEFCKDKKCKAYIPAGGCYNMHSEMCCYTAYQYFEWFRKVIKKEKL